MAQTGIALAAIAGICLTAPAWAAPSGPVLMATPPQPMWYELTTAQKIILAPLCDDWDAMEAYRQKTWLTIASRFPEMTPQEQRRVQEQMQTWSKLTNEERIAAREFFEEMAQMPAAQRERLRQQWKTYSNLPEEEKEKLKKMATKLPQSQTTRPAAPVTTPTPSPAPNTAGTPAAPAPAESSQAPDAQ